MFGLWASSGYGTPTGEIHTAQQFWSESRGLSALPLNSWTHLATTYDGATLKLNVNGQLVDSEVRSSDLRTWPNGFMIGRNEPWGEYFAGRLDEVRLYHRVLKQGELQADMSKPLCPVDANTSVENVQLIDANASWRYLDNGSNQDKAWREIAFDDSRWKVGSAEFGYGAGDETTVVNYGPNSSSKYVTTYFRHAFQLLSPQSYSQLTLQLRRDDGAVVYLNGKEVTRSNMPNGTIAHTTFASSAIGATDEQVYHSFSISGKELRCWNSVSWNSVSWNSAIWDDESLNASAAETVPATEEISHATDSGRAVATDETEESTQIFVPIVIR